MFHLRIEVGRWWLQVGRDAPPEPEQHPPLIDTHPTPQTVYTPDFVGFVKLSEPDE